MATVVSADAPTRLRRRRTEGPADTSSVNANLSRFEDPPGHTPVNQPTDLPLDSDQTVPRSRRASRTPSMNSIRSKFASMVCPFDQIFLRSSTVIQDKSVPVAFTFSTLPPIYRLLRAAMGQSLSQTCYSSHLLPDSTNLWHINVTTGRRYIHGKTDNIRPPGSVRPQRTIGNPHAESHLPPHGIHSCGHQPQIPHPPRFAWEPISGVTFKSLKLATRLSVSLALVDLLPWITPGNRSSHHK